jgi:hypothetical protein
MQKFNVLKYHERYFLLVPMATLWLPNFSNSKRNNAPQLDSRQCLCFRIQSIYDSSYILMFDLRIWEESSAARNVIFNMQAWQKK